MMKTVVVETWLEYLGKSHSELIGIGLDSKLKFIKLYPGATELYIEPEPGVSYCFDAETKVLQAIIVVLIKEVKLEPEFAGVLSSPYGCQDKEAVQLIWGSPLKSQGPTSLPQPIGKIGGWDIYGLSARGYEGFELTYQYASDLRVSKVVLETKKDEA